jgi:hypothetical protein
MQLVPVQLKASSPRWTVLAVIVGLIGVPAGFAVLISMFQIDDAKTLGPMSAVQDSIAVTAVFVGLFGINGGSIYLALRLGRRPSAAIATFGLVVYNVHSLLVPWQMISGMTTFRRRGGRSGPAVLLADGDVLPLRFAPTSAYWSAPGDGSSNVRRSVEETILDALREHTLAADSVPAPLPALTGGTAGTTAGTTANPRPEPGSLRQHRLPGTPVYELSPRRMPLSWRMLPFYLAIIGIADLRTAQGGQPFRLTEFVLGVGAIVAVGCALVAIRWTRWSRTVAVGTDWIAWRPRWDASGWRVLPLARLVSITPGIDWGRWQTLGRSANAAPRGGGVALRRSDGRGIQLRADELTAGTAAAMLPLVDGHPGLAAQMRSVLARYAVESAAAGPADADPTRPVS